MATIAVTPIGPRIAIVLTTGRTMPLGIVLFLAYAAVILAGIGVTLPRVIELATGAMPITFEGLVVMILLAYTVFTTTLVLQRKEAARNLALGLTSLLLPGAGLALLGGFVPFAAILVILAILLVRSLRGAGVRAWLSEP
jgi:hypothetical protein